MKHTLSVVVQNEAGVLSRVAGLFSGRGYNIESLTVAQTLDKGFSRLTIITTGDDKVIEQICKQLNKLVNTIKVVELSNDNLIDRELLLVKVCAKDEDRSELLRIAEIFNANLVDVSKKTYTLEIMGSANRLKSFIELLKPLGIKEMARSGVVAIAKENLLLENSF